jgi:hypothetical protein
VNDAVKALFLSGVLLAAWLMVRRARRERMETGSLEFEELAEPAVLSLGLDPE